MRCTFVTLSDVIEPTKSESKSGSMGFQFMFE